MDPLKCPLCFESHQNPKMCPNCSQVFCELCIKSYSELHHFCPSCNCFLFELADCKRLIEQVKEKVCLKGRQQFVKCKRHGLPMKYSCQDCRIAICSDCGVIDEQHRNHTITPKKSQTNQLNKNKLREYLLNIDEKIMALHHKHDKHTLEQQVLKSQLKWCKQKISSFCDQMIQKAENQARLFSQEIDNDIEEEMSAIQFLKKLKKDIMEAIETNGVEEQKISQRVSPQNQILGYLQTSLNDNDFVYAKIQEKLSQNEIHSAQFEFTRKSISTLSQMHPQYSNHTFEFNYAANQKQLVTYSETVSIFGNEWRLKIYPKGKGQCRGSHLSLFLQLVNVHVSRSQAPGSDNHDLCDKVAFKYDYRLELINLSLPAQTLSKQYCSLFTPGESWGYNNFLSLAELESYLLNNSQLIFVVGLRNISYHDMCVNLKNYTKKVEKEKRILEELMAENNCQQSQSFSLDYPLLSVEESSISFSENAVDYQVLE